jgi:hypothetical protein
MVILRAIGWAFIVLGLLVLGRDLWAWGQGGPFRMISGGELWFTLDNASLNLVQAVTQRYVAAALWDPVAVTVLLWPAALTLAGFGVILVLLFQGRRRRRR